MPNDNLLANFTDYIKSLCASHVEILHTSSRKHFIELNDDEQLQNSKSLCYPLVALEKLSVFYNGQEDSALKNRHIEMMFLQTVKDAGDFTKIQEVKNAMERIAEDFIKKMKVDRKNRKIYPFLKNMVLSNIELNFVENKGMNLYGALISFDFELKFDETLEVGRFV